jgi:P4 family phage/plasmid primase-like protien
MRMQTVVSPNWAAQGFYQFFCPEWMQYINFLANGDERYVRLLRRYGALCLTGYERDLYFLFMWGVPNSAKSVFQDVLQRLQGNYIKSVSPGFFMRQLDKRTFELYQLKGRRGAFADEVPKGGTWDVQLLSTMFSGRQLQAEGKGKAFIEFRNTAKVIVAGNHQPRFPSSNEKDGLDRRMLLLEFDRTVEQGGIKDDRMFPVKVVEAEGSAILMWFLEDAQAGYQDLLEQGSFMGDTVDIGLELAAKYRLKANPHNQWVDEGAIRDPEATMPAKTAWYLYMEWGDRQGLWKHQKKETYDDFVTAMRTIGFFVKCPTDHRKGRAMLIYGLREQTYSSADLAAAE